MQAEQYDSLLRWPHFLVDLNIIQGTSSRSIEYLRSINFFGNYNTYKYSVHANTITLFYIKNNNLNVKYVFILTTHKLRIQLFYILPLQSKWLRLYAYSAVNCVIYYEKHLKHLKILDKMFISFDLLIWLIFHWFYNN